MTNYDYSLKVVQVRDDSHEFITTTVNSRLWKHGRAMACHSKYSPQAEDRKHGFVNRRAR